MASILLWNLHFWTNNGWESACSHKSSWTTCRCFPGEAYLSNVPATQWKPGKARRAKDSCQRLEHAAAFLEAIQNAAQDSCEGVASRAFLCLCAGHRHATFPQKRPCKCGYRGFGYTCACSMGAIGALRKKFFPRIPAWGWFSGLPTTVTLVSQESVPSPIAMKPARPSQEVDEPDGQEALVFAWAVG